MNELIEKVAEELNWYGNSDSYIDWNVAGNDEIKERRRAQAKDILPLILGEIKKGIEDRGLNKLDGVDLFPEEWQSFWEEVISE